MALPFREAADIAWTALLDEVGELHIPTCREVGIIDSSVTKDGSPDENEHWHVIFLDVIYRTDDPRDNVVGRVWVDKQTGHCNLWVNEEYGPIFTENVEAAKARFSSRGFPRT